MISKKEHSIRYDSLEFFSTDSIANWWYHKPVSSLTSPGNDIKRAAENT